MATLLIDIHDVTTQPIKGDTVTLTAPAPRPATGGGVTRPFNRLVTLVDGKTTVEVDPGPLRVTFHDGYGREVIIDTRVPDDGDVVTLRELIVAEIGDLDDVPGIREALDGKADVEHEHRVSDIVDLDDALGDMAPASHTHEITDVRDLESSLGNKADVNHRHTINDVDDLTWSLDQKVNVSDLHESVNDFSAQYLARIVDGAPESLDTLREVAAEFERQDDAIEAVFTELAKRAMKSHNHAISDVTGLQSALDSRATTTALKEGLSGKASKSHSHTSADVTDGVLWVGQNHPQPRAVVKTNSDGYLHVPLAPTDPAHVANKSYVDNQIKETTTTQTSTASGTGWSARKVDNLVELRIYALSSAAVLPEGFRPASALYFAVSAKQSGEYSPRIAVSPAGNVTPQSFTGDAYGFVTYSVV